MSCLLEFSNLLAAGIHSRRIIRQTGYGTERTVLFPR